jgi:D-alanyl-D-alanine carboxypeptidase
MSEVEERLRAGADYVEKWLECQFRARSLPGLAVAVRSGSQTLMARGFGFAHVDEQTSFSDRHHVRIASQSKMFTATALFILAERGLLRLDDEASRYVSWFRSRADPELERVTLRELVSHGSGITRDSEDATFWEPERLFPDEEELKEIVRDSHLVIPRNDRFKYSNIGFGVLASVIAEVSGQSFEEFVRSAILDPIGLADTGVDIGEHQGWEMASGYGPSFFGEARGVYPPIKTGALASATGFYSTVHDMGEFAAAHFFNDERLLTDASKREMQKVQWHLPVDGQDYGSGFDLVTVGGRRLLGHRGAFPGVMSCTRFDPIDRLAVSVAINCQDGPARLLTESIVAILNFFVDPNLPEYAASRSPAEVRRFNSRLFSPWGVTDFVPVDRWLAAVDPREVNPFRAPTIMQVTGPRTVSIAATEGYGSYREQGTFEFDPEDNVKRAMIAGEIHYTWDDYLSLAAPSRRLPTA